MTIPIVMVHGGKVRPNQTEDFLITTLKQARQWNDWVILLGGPRVKDHASEAQVGFFDYFNLYYKGAQQFLDDVYVQMSHYHQPYDIAVMERYFVLQSFMADWGIDTVCNLDSDVMVYCDLTEEESKIERPYDAAYCIPLNQPKYRLSASAHTSFFTKTGIDKFCEFLLDSYTVPDMFAILKEKWDWHIREKRPGGVCDMTHLYLFSKDQPTVHNLTGKVEGDGVFEHNIRVSENGLPDEFQMLKGKKEIVWRDGLPYGYSLRLERWVRFNTLHLQADAKESAQHYYRERHSGQIS